MKSIKNGSRILIPILMIWTLGCRDIQPETALPASTDGGQAGSQIAIDYAHGFTAFTDSLGITQLEIRNPWPEATKVYRYALVPKELLASVSLPANVYDAIVPIPVERVVLTSTTHIPALEILGILETLVGFPGLDYISSESARARVQSGELAEIGANEQLNIEKVLELSPDLVVGFGVSDAPGSYGSLIQAGIPVVYNGDWMEQSPLGKAEWVKFFSLFYGLESRAADWFDGIVAEYGEAQELAASSPNRPTVLSGALYRDVWYLPAGNSWAARFLEDANAQYLWADTPGTGSLNLSLESVLAKGTEADFWVAPSQFTSYGEMSASNEHYKRFKAYRQQKVFGYAEARGDGGGLLYYELGPSRPDLILKDLIHFLHPGLLPDYRPVFFNPLEP